MAVEKCINGRRAAQIAVYPESEWKHDSVSAEFCCKSIGKAEPFSVVVHNTIRIWEEVLQVREEDDEGAIYIAKLDEKDCREDGIVKAESPFYKTYYAVVPWD